MAPQAMGRILIIGIGPGNPEGMTLAARAALEAAQVVIGYRPYLEQVAELIKDKPQIARGMRQEMERCADAIRLAQAGQVVALISSGDAGIYGMAGPLLEMLLAAGWTPETGPTVEVVPGVSALNACAALVGAPLTHDFCAISLSDLLTPWPVIQKRLAAAAMADFVTVLYNPRSRRRTTQLAEAKAIFLEYREPFTPVAVVREAYRQSQSILLTSLEQLDDTLADMNTTLIIGNSQTRIQGGRMITPRGYAGKYGPLDAILTEAP